MTLCRGFGFLAEEEALKDSAESMWVYGATVSEWRSGSRRLVLLRTQEEFSKEL